MIKNREIWSERVDEYQKRMQEGLKQVLQNREIIEEAKWESEEDDASSNKVSSFDDSTPQSNSLSQINEDSLEFRQTPKKNKHSHNSNKGLKKAGTVHLS